MDELKRNDVESNGSGDIEIQNSSIHEEEQPCVDASAVGETKESLAEPAPVESESAPADSEAARGSYSEDTGGVSNSTPVYYTESYKKPKSAKKTSILQLITVSLISAIIGAGVMFTAIYFVLPEFQPSVNSFLYKSSSAEEAASGTADGENQTQGYKKIEITKSDSPVSAIAEKVVPSVVGIRTTGTGSDWFLGGTGGGEGSGIIVSSDGHILTNRHVVQNASKIEVFLHGQKNKAYPAKLVGISNETDIAVLKIEATGLTPADLGNSDQVVVGEIAVAVGNPGGLDLMGSVTAGVISGKDREVVSEDGTKIKALQTDAAINRGNSGGALVNSQGEVIGINTLKGSTEMGYEGLGFAIPINYARDIMNKLIKTSQAPLIGVTVDQSYTKEIAKENNWPEGLYVIEVTPFKGAYVAGIKVNDIITKFDGQRITSYDEMTDLRLKRKPGDVVEVEVYRDGQYLTFDVKLFANNP